MVFVPMINTTSDQWWAKKYAHLTGTAALQAKFQTRRKKNERPT